jgi:hypothetical protein
MVDGLVWIPGHANPIRVKPETALFTPEGVEAMTINNFSAESTQVPETHEIIMAAQSQHRSVVLDTTELRIRNHPANVDFQPHVRIEESSTLHPVERLRVQWNVQVTTAPFPLEHGGMQGKAFAWGSGKVAGVDTLLVLTGNDQKLESGVEAVESMPLAEQTDT